MTETQPSIRNIIEAALFSAETSLTVKQLQMLFPRTGRPDRAAILTIIETLIVDYNGRGVELVCTATGYRFQTRANYADWLRRLREIRPPRYSRALLETLAIIAYRQPVTRGDIEEIRGVTVTTEIMRALLDREWVRQTGVRDVPGHPALYCTTANFLEYFGLVSLENLPELEDPRQVGDIVRELNFDLPVEEEWGKSSGSDPERDEPPTGDLPVIDLDASQDVIAELSEDKDTGTGGPKLSGGRVAESNMAKVVTPSGE